jgi:RNA polymerase sigma-70 factor (ECF subfamily)
LGGAPRGPSTTEVDREQERIAAALAAGDARAALPLLIDRYGERVYRYCRRMLGNDAEAQDAFQMAFMQAFEAIRRGAQVDNPGAWLCGIARHRCLDIVEGRSRRPVPLDAQELERMIDADVRGGGQPHDPRLQRLLDECLDELDPRSRTAVLLRHHDHLSYEDISGKTGDPPGALRVRVARALAILRRCLEKKGGAL